MSPHFMTSHIPENERGAVFKIDDLLDNLERYVKKFDHAVQLFDFSEARYTELITPTLNPDLDGHARAMLRRANATERDKYKAWQLCAAGDAAMEIYHFAVILAAIKSSVNRIPIFGSHFDKHRFRVAEDHFDRTFAGHEYMRHAVSHLAQVTLSHARNATNDEFTSGSVSIAANSSTLYADSIEDKTYFNTHEGSIYQLDITAQNTKILNEVLDYVHCSFKPVIHAMGALGMGEVLSKKERP